ncbi:MAG TPA: DUF5996 family protein, partial [Gemmatimonadales bacterium]|nr:DUF5996 family protein [Gemmatimonadales bacterium]
MSAPTGTSPPATATEWPVLSLDEWNPTRDTLHRWVQIIGKTRLALASPVNHWWHVALYATAQGLTTSSMPYGAGAIEVELDFVHHELRVTASDGSSGALQLGPRSVAQFYAEYLRLLGSLGVRIHLWP